LVRSALSNFISGSRRNSCRNSWLADLTTLECEKGSKYFKY